MLSLLIRFFLSLITLSADAGRSAGAQIYLATRQAVRSAYDLRGSKTLAQLQ